MTRFLTWDLIVTRPPLYHWAIIPCSFKMEGKNWGNYIISEQTNESNKNKVDKLSCLTIIYLCHQTRVCRTLMANHRDSNSIIHQHLAPRLARARGDVWKCAIFIIQFVMVPWGASPLAQAKSELEMLDRPISMSQDCLGLKFPVFVRSPSISSLANLARKLFKWRAFSRRSPSSS